MLPIAHCLYRGAYSGLCCGNVYRDMKEDGTKERYDLGDKIYPVTHGHSYRVTVELESNELDKNGMVVDFKLFKKILKGYFEQYDHSCILTPDNPLVKLYEGGNYPKLHIWDENPTAEYMSKYWHDTVQDLMEKNGLTVNDLSLTVEETSHNSVEYC